MCLLIYKPANKSVPSEFLKHAESNNPHGAGIAIADGEKILIQKGEKWGASEIEKWQEEYKQYPAIIHFRYATHGDKDYINTHPFPVDEKWVAAHNGIISGGTCGKNESDSRAFIREHVVPIVKAGCDLSDPDIVTVLGEKMTTSNKMVFLSVEGKVGIANENSGHIKDGIWYSNTTYVESRYQYTDLENWSEDYYHGHYLKGQRYTSPVKSTLNDVVGKQEFWHSFIAHEMICDYCKSSLHGEDFHMEGVSGLCICGQCMNAL